MLLAIFKFLNTFDLFTGI